MTTVDVCYRVVGLFCFFKQNNCVAGLIFTFLCLKLSTETQIKYFLTKVITNEASRA